MTRFKETIEQIERHTAQIRAARLDLVAELAALPPLTLQCDGCEETFPVEQTHEVDGPDGWTMCAACKAKHDEPLDPMRGVEFPFAANH